MKRIVAFAAVLAMALVLIATPGFAVAGVTGSATTNNTILSVGVGSTGVRLGIDLADVLNASQIHSTTKLITGKIGSQTLPGGQQRTATKASESGKEAIKPGTQSVAGLGNLTVAGGFIQSTVSDSEVSSVVDFAAGAVDALDGLVNVATMDSTTNASVDGDSSSVERLLTIGDVDVLNLGALLDNLGIDPLALACDAVVDTGTALGIGSEVSGACDQLTDVQNEIDGGMASIGDTETVLTALSTALTVACPVIEGLVPGACDTVEDQITTLTGDIDDIQTDDPDVCATVSDALDEVSAQLGGILDSLGVLDAISDIDAIIAPVTDQLGDIDSAASTLEDACNTLVGTVEGLLDTPLLVLDGIQVAMNLVADKTPSSAVGGSVGSLKVGSITIADGDDLVTAGADLQEKIDEATAQLADVFNALGLAGLPVPSLDVLSFTHDDGKKADGTSFAKATMRAAHLAIPSSPNVDVPVDLPLDVLSGIGTFGLASVRAAAVSTPAVVVDAGVFSGQATFKPVVVGNNGDTLPNTGLAGTGLAIFGLISLAGARILRRITKAV